MTAEVIQNVMTFSMAKVIQSQLNLVRPTINPIEMGFMNVMFHYMITMQLSKPDLQILQEHLRLMLGFPLHYLQVYVH